MSSDKRKVRKYRGSKTHGGGAMKKRRGAGSRAGRGRAGSGKRGDQQKPSYWKTWQMGGKGFHKHNATKIVAINVSDLDRAIPNLVEEGKANKKGDSFIIDLNELGYDKLLGSGSVNLKLTVTVDQATDLAVKKIEDAGGSVTVKGSDSDEE